MEHHLTISESNEATFSCHDPLCYHEYPYGPRVECAFDADVDTLYEQVYESVPERYAIGDYVLKPATYVFHLDWDEGGIDFSFRGVEGDFLTHRKWVGPYLLKFIWEGGEYIQVSFDKNEDDTFHALNVWDSAKDERTIPFTLAALEAEVRDFSASTEEMHNYADSIGVERKGQ